MAVNTAKTRQVIVAMTGASGAAYGLRLIQSLHVAGVELHLIFSDAARIVLLQECDLSLPEDPAAAQLVLIERLALSEADRVHTYGLKDWFSPAASGSSGICQMVVAPCSMGTLARIAQGMSENLIERAADVMLKEKGQLILMPRETPLSAIHLQHMLSLATLGVEIIPAMPAFYHRPQSIAELQAFMVERVLDHLHIAQENIQRWGISNDR
ncbi:MAG: flavin prenyltransferase UbiX [Mariprofundaceae bacterium]|nr:flavin prenyltransferase UbiX [Mariprofundaceae bacterium]